MFLANKTQMNYNQTETIVFSIKARTKRYNEVFAFEIVQCEALLQFLHAFPKENRMGILETIHPTKNIIWLASRLAKAYIPYS